MASYAKHTKVSTERSLAEIQKILERYGATQFGYAEDRERNMASVQFFAHERHVRFLLQLPNKRDKEFHFTSQFKRRTSVQAEEAWKQACRSRWRSLLLAIKAKLEAVSAGISVFEEEFLANIVLPDGNTVATLLRPQLVEAYSSGRMIPGIANLLEAPKPVEEDDYEVEEGEIAGFLPAPNA